MYIAIILLSFIEMLVFRFGNDSDRYGLFCRVFLRWLYRTEYSEFPYPRHKTTQHDEVVGVLSALEANDP